MKFTCLLENTACDPRLSVEHGLSVLAETPLHTLLFDTGATGVFADNAAALGVDLKKVDTAILSHGHYDHGGGLRRFLSENETAPVWLHRQAFVLHRALHGDELVDIGLDPALQEEPRLRFVDADIALDDELTLLTGITGDELSPRGNKTIFAERDGILTYDDFAHEQDLVIRAEGKTVLLAGCAHRGIVNILEACRARLGAYPDAVIGGFHLMRRTRIYDADDLAGFDALAKRLAAIPTQYFSCHCTGEEPFARLKQTLGSRLQYLSCGDTLTI